MSKGISAGNMSYHNSAYNEGPFAPLNPVHGVLCLNARVFRPPDNLIAEAEDPISCKDRMKSNYQYQRREMEFHAAELIPRAAVTDHK